MKTSAALAKPMGGASHATPAIIGVIGFLTLVDLFATQAILPTLATRYDVSPAEMGVAVNASTFGMAAAGICVALFGGRLARRFGVVASLTLLSVPTLALSVAPDLTTFSLLRIVQGVFMAAAFSLTMAYLAERCTAAASASALAAYVTGAVASNLFGRLIASSLASSVGVGESFAFFAALNVAGAVLAFYVLGRARPMTGGSSAGMSPFNAVAAHLRNSCLLAGFAIGFLILFAFVGVFTYVNFVLAAEPLSLSPMRLGLVYFVFLPAMITTPLAGKIAARFGARLSFLVSLGASIAALPLIAIPNLPVMLFGLAIVGAGTFFAQATATGFVGRAAKTERAAASGVYLASYYLGGLAGAALIGRIFEMVGWTAAVFVVGLALAAAALAALTLKRSTAEPACD